MLDAYAKYTKHTYNIIGTYIKHIKRHAQNMLNTHAHNILKSCMKPY